MLVAQTIVNLREAMEFCGYDLAEIMGNKTRRRDYTDLRKIVWCIFSEELRVGPSQIGRAFGWDRATIHIAISKAKDLLKTDRLFADMYDSVLSAYRAIEAKNEEENGQQCETESE